MASDAAIETKQWGLIWNSIYEDADNVWTASDQLQAIDTHVNTTIVYDYLLSTFAVNSYDDHGSSMVSVANVDRFGIVGGFVQCRDNAFWDGDQINVCPGSVFPNGLSADLDVIGHEWGHAVTDYAQGRGAEGLIYARESGAIDEAFSDWLGTAIEHSNGEVNWTFAENGVPPLGARSLQNPLLFEQPDTYGGANWFDVDSCLIAIGIGLPGDNDNCGVHTNSGVGNKAFYLSAGGTHNSVTVTGIGIAKAINIAVRANLMYWPDDATYVDAMNGMIRAADDLYGTSSAELSQVKNAWAAVNVIDQPVVTGTVNPTIVGIASGGEYKKNKLP